MLNEQVVLDTATPIVYIGKLVDITAETFVLADADLHDCRDGHAHKERYLAEARACGISVNRRRLIVARSAVMSVSRLADVVTEMMEELD